jgi:hypothetical protein
MFIITPGIIALIAHAVVGIGIAATATTAILNFTQIIDWFNALRTGIPQVEESRIYFSMLDLLAAGDYNTVYGVFDTRTQRLGNVRSDRSANIDARLAGYHRKNRLVTYE